METTDFRPYGHFHYKLRPERLIKNWHDDIYWTLPVTNGEKSVSITFDDGPTEEDTPEILTILREFGVNATFFLDGENLFQNPDIAHAILMDGHTIGNHSSSHIAPILLSLRRFENQLLHFEEIMTGFGFPTPQLYRPPNGIMTGNQVRLTQSLGYNVIMGDVYPRDAQRVKAASLYSWVLNDTQPGSIIILHAGVPGNQRRKTNMETAKALRKILPAILEEGYEFVDIQSYLRGDI